MNLIGPSIKEDHFLVAINISFISKNNFKIIFFSNRYMSRSYCRGWSSSTRIIQLFSPCLENLIFSHWRQVNRKHSIILYAACFISHLLFIISKRKHGWRGGRREGGGGASTHSSPARESQTRRAQRYSCISIDHCHSLTILEIPIHLYSIDFERSNRRTLDK